jgi:polysaccharide export outer membrane protein
MEKLIRAILTAVFMITAITAWANPVQGGSSPTPYRIKVGDVLRIMVYNEAMINSLQTVYPDGRISPPFLPSLEVQGKTTDEIAAELRKGYAEVLHLKDPKVAVSIELYRPIRASISGAVLQSGTYDQFRPGEELVHLISRGGGTIPDRADLRRATLTRAGSKEVIPINLYDLLIVGDKSQNYVLEDGDSLYVPFREFETINVQGAIAAPGSYPYKEGMTIIDAISMARGWIPIRSKMSEVIIMRKKPGAKRELVYYKVNYVKLLQRDMTQNMELMPGDSIYVSETKTPDINQITSIFSAIYYVDRLLRDGFFGLRIFN